MRNVIYNTLYCRYLNIQDKLEKKIMKEKEKVKK